MERTLVIRIGLDLLLFVGVFLFPYWLMILSAAVIAIAIPFYIEFIFLAVFEEMLYFAAGATPTGLLLPLGLFSYFILLEASRSLVRERFLRL